VSVHDGPQGFFHVDLRLFAAMAAIFSSLALKTLDKNTRQYLFTVMTVISQ